jgi:site-specific DNA-methyltransferase (adenine-specific)
MTPFSPWGAGKNDKPVDNTGTPQDLYNSLEREFHFDHDPCPLNPDGLRSTDGLGDWGKSNFVNPPYSNKEPWIKKACLEREKGNLTVMLLPVDTSTAWFHDYILPNCEIRWLRGRLTFHARGSPAKFASMLCIFRPKVTAYESSPE